jgi:hypothetical protein
MPFGWIVSRISRGLSLGVVPGLTVSIVYILTVVAVGALTACVLSSHHKTAEGVRMTRLSLMAEYYLGPVIGAAVATIPQQLSLAGTPIMFLISGGTSLAIISDFLNGSGADMVEFDELVSLQEDQHWIIVFTVMCMATAMMVRGYEDLWYLSAASLVLLSIYRTVSLVANIIVIKQFGIHSFECVVRHPGQPAVVEMLFAMGTVVTCLSLHPVLVEVQATIAEPPSAAYSVRIGILTASALGGVYAAISSVTGYLAYGDCYDQNALAMPMPGEYSWLPVLANALSLIDVVTSVQLYAQPIITDLAEALELCVGGGKLTDTSGEGSESARPGRRGGWAPFLVGPFIIGLYGTMAYILPELGTVCALIGAASTIPLLFVTPSLIHLFAGPSSWGKRLVFWPLVLLGGVLSAAMLAAVVFALLMY